jgi:hypothetical protein
MVKKCKCRNLHLREKININSTKCPFFSKRNIFSIIPVATKRLGSGISNIFSTVLRDATFSTHDSYFARPGFKSRSGD